MHVQKSDSMLQYFSFFFSTKQRYAILKSISERKWTIIAILFNNRSNNIFSWRNFCLTIKFCQNLGYSLEEPSENLNIFDLNFLCHLLFNAEYSFSNYDNIDLGFFLVMIQYRKTQRFNFVNNIAFDFSSYFIPPKDILKKLSIFSRHSFLMSLQLVKMWILMQNRLSNTCSCKDYYLVLARIGSLIVWKMILFTQKQHQ